MRKSLLYKLLLSYNAIIGLVYCQAQSSFAYKSHLAEIKSAGFYKIVLPPGVVSKCNNELNDIRILNSKGIQSPYILKSDQAKFEEKNFIELPIIDVRKEADKQTHIIIQNKLTRPIDQLLLVIKNTDAERTVTISGSDDQNKWFVIKENISLNNLFVQEQDRFIQSLSFPNSSYKFFEIIINGKDQLPVNIVKAGIYEGVPRNGDFLEIPQPKIIQIDSSNKFSYINLKFDDNYLVNKLQLDIRGPKFFRRNVTILKYENDYVSFKDEYVLSSTIDASYTVNIKTKSLTLIIENQDSPPLNVASVKAYQLNKYVLTYLEPSVSYDLLFGDSLAGAPKYDLEFFKDSINNTPAEASLGPITKIDNEKAGIKQPGSQNTLILWIIIGSVLVLLLVLTFRMTKEVNKKNDSL
jgi:hypothetical protein